MSNTKEININNRVYEIQRFPFRDALKIRTKLASMLLPSIGQFVGEGLKMWGQLKASGLSPENKLTPDVEELEDITDEFTDMDSDHSVPENESDDIKDTDVKTHLGADDTDRSNESTIQLLSQIDAQVLAKVGALLSRRMSEKNVEYMYYNLLSVVIYNNQPLSKNLDFHFIEIGCKWSTIDKLLIEVIKHNDFLDLRGYLEKLNIES